MVRRDGVIQKCRGVMNRIVKRANQFVGIYQDVVGSKILKMFIIIFRFKF